MRQIILYILSAAFIFTFPFATEAIKDDALVLYLSFNEGNGQAAKDLSGKGNDGTLEGDVKWVKNGKSESAVSFSEQVQQGVVAVKASNSLAITKNLTMAVWVYPVEYWRSSQPTRAGGPSHILSEYPSRETFGLDW